MSPRRISRHQLRLSLTEPRREPALERAVSDRVDGVLANRQGARPVHIGCLRPEPGRGATEHEALHALGRVCGHPDARHRADRDAAQRGPLDLEPVHQRQQVLAQVGDRIRTRRRRGPAVPAQVIADDPVAFGQRGSLRIPHRPIGPQRAAEDHRRPVHRPYQLVGDLDAHLTPRPAAACAQRAPARSTRPSRRGTAEDRAQPPTPRDPRRRTPRACRRALHETLAHLEPTPPRPL